MVGFNLYRPTFWFKEVKLTFSQFHSHRITNVSITIKRNQQLVSLQSGSVKTLQSGVIYEVILKTRERKAKSITGKLPDRFHTFAVDTNNNLSML